MEMNLDYQFLISVFTAALMLLVPGVLALRSIGFHRRGVFACAPLVSLFFYLVEAIVFSFLGIECTGSLLFLSWASIAAVLFVCGRKHQLKVGGPRGVKDQSNLVLIGCIVFMALVYVYSFYGELSGADFAIQGYDSVYHYNQVRTFLDSGVYSPLVCSSYPKGDLSPFIVSDTGFYPAAWHLLVAMCVDISGIALPVAANGITAFSIIFIFSIGMQWLLREIFSDSEISKYGVVSAPASIVFPWSMLVRGEQYPQLLAFCLVPSVVALFIVTTSSFVYKTGSTKGRVSSLLICLASLFVLAMGQPNAVFTAGLFILFYWLGFIFLRAKCSDDVSDRNSPKRWILFFGLILFAITAWFALYKAPFMRGVVEYPGWLPFATPVQALANLFNSNYLQSTQPQIVLSLLALIGVSYALFDHRYRWLIVLVLFNSLIYVADVSFGGVVQHLFAGFWYSDPDRISAMLSISMVPLVTLGLYTVSKLLLVCFGSICGHTGNTQILGSNSFWSMTLVVLIFSVLIYFPNYNYGAESISTAFGMLKARVGELCSDNFPGVLDETEKEFVNRAKALISDGSLIVNIPDDGSSFLYGFDGMNVLYRRNHFGGHDGKHPNESDDSWIVRSRLYRLSEDSSVQDAVRRMGAAYVLLLDADDPDGVHGVFHTYQDEDWKGISSISDSTPGFELLLSEGDMRLYRLILPDE